MGNDLLVLEKNSLKWLSDHKRSLACDFSLVWNFWLCSRQYFRLLSCSRIILLDLINFLWSDLIQTHSDSFRLFQTQSGSFRLIQTHSDSWRCIRRIFRKMTLLARMMRLKSHFLKRCSLSERLKMIFWSFRWQFETKSKPTLKWKIVKKLQFFLFLEVNNGLNWLL